MDYWALGHIHKQQILHQDPYIVYPGNIQGRNPKEHSSKGCFAVTLSENETTLQAIETSDILWESLSISAKEITHFHDLFIKCKDEVNALRKQKQAVLLKLEIQDTDRLETNAVEKIMNGELLEVLQDGEEQEDTFVWTYQINVRETDKDAQQILENQTFLKELHITIEEFNQDDIFEGAIEELFSHLPSSRYLNKISHEEKEELLVEANQMLLQILREK